MAVENLNSYFQSFCSKINPRCQQVPFSPFPMINSNQRIIPWNTYLKMLKASQVLNLEYEIFVFIFSGGRYAVLSDSCHEML